MFTIPPTIHFGTRPRPNFYDSNSPILVVKENFIVLCTAGAVDFAVEKAPSSFTTRARQKALGTVRNNRHTTTSEEATI